MNNGWTPERQQRQAKLIRKWKPWLRSTGAKIPEGKRKEAMRGYKGTNKLTDLKV